MTIHRPATSVLVWLYALGYFACYVPYSALTKEISLGRMPPMTQPVSGFALLPVATFASLVGMGVLLTAARWWRHAGHRVVLGLRVPFPGPWTFLSGIATAAIIGTTTLAYTFDGLSIVFMMLLMRGGVLVLAPIVDALSGRAVKDRSWIALGLSLAALAVTVTDAKSFELTAIAAIDVAVYLAGYFVRLRFMSKLAKSESREASLKYFVEEQMVATPAIVATLAVVALVGQGAIGMEVRRGFTEIGSSGAVLAAILVGVLSQGTGVFGGLVLLDKRENTFCVPVNRASSVLAGLLASVLLTAVAGSPSLPSAEIGGAFLILAAIVVLATPTLQAMLAHRPKVVPGKSPA